MKTTASKVRISITIFPFINTMLENACEQTGISKSSLIEKAVKEFLREKLGKDAEALSRLRFDDVPSEEEWLQIQSPLGV